MRSAIAHKVPLIIDADGIWVLRSMRDVVLPDTVIITPNQRELDAFGISAEDLARKFNAIIIVKGLKDLITDGKISLFSQCSGSPKRCSG